MFFFASFLKYLDDSCSVSKIYSNPVGVGVAMEVDSWQNKWVSFKADNFRMQKVARNRTFFFQIFIDYILGMSSVGLWAVGVQEANHSHSMLKWISSLG